jgi:hypothetical protein
MVCHRQVAQLGKLRPWTPDQVGGDKVKVFEPSAPCAPLREQIFWPTANTMLRMQMAYDLAQVRAR